MVLVPRTAYSFNTIPSSVILIENDHSVLGELARTTRCDSAIHVWRLNLVRRNQRDDSSRSNLGAENALGLSNKFDPECTS